jgi:hypothetical protein
MPLTKTDLTRVQKSRTYFIEEKDLLLNNTIRKQLKKTGKKPITKAITTYFLSNRRPLAFVFCFPNDSKRMKDARKE